MFQISSLEQDLEKLESNLRKRKEEVDKAENERNEYNTNIDSLEKWLESVESRLQIRDEPQLLKEKVLKVAAELPSILEKMERTKMISKSIMDNTPDKSEVETIKKTIAGPETELNRINSLVDERMNLVIIICWFCSCKLY